MRSRPLIDLEQEFERVIEALNREGIPYAVCGGMAFSILCEPRNTQDIDLLVKEKDLDRIQETLEPIGYLRYGSPTNFQESGVTLHRLLKIEEGGPDHMILDFITGPEEPYEEILDRAEKFNWKDHETPVVQPEDLIKLKKKRNSPRDREDIRKLKETIQDHEE